MGFSLGKYQFQTGVLLAPMAGITDSAFRRVCKMLGAEYMVSEMISAKALYYHDKKTHALAKITASEAPTALQIFGSEPEIMAYAAKTLSFMEKDPVCRPAAIDINMGCPVPKVVNNGEGSALMKNPLLAGKIMEAVRRATDLPVTVKFRTGFTKDTRNCVEIAHIAVECGIDMLMVHGRTRQQMYTPPVDLDSISSVRSAVPNHIPVIGNGDIMTGADARHMMQVTGCDGVALARGVCGNPWLFSEVICALQNKPYTPPSPQEKMQVAKYHLQLLTENKGEHIGVLQARKHLAWYTKGLHGSTVLREQINHTETLEEMLALVENCQNWIES